MDTRTFRSSALRGWHRARCVLSNSMLPAERVSMQVATNVSQYSEPSENSRPDRHFHMTCDFHAANIDMRSIQQGETHQPKEQQSTPTPKLEKANESAVVSIDISQLKAVAACVLAVRSERKQQAQVKNPFTRTQRMFPEMNLQAR